MDPTPGDSDAIFIHPPFTDFPEAHRFKEGLTYNIMAQHRNWFLDTGDFISPANDKPNAVNYPPSWSRLEAGVLRRKGNSKTAGLRVRNPDFGAPSADVPTPV
ncbi:hypothetical protein A0H81_00878 [Grifola frondosa]|uniref:Uncharacterized protein n=1 Tax=Grifola frondosa TaxID=5627 RepID=A0A1C7MQQ2_GRIFR|nr:hypothetical protein A0H81_00878 [Grifola frondosa]